MMEGWQEDKVNKERNKHQVKKGRDEDMAKKGKEEGRNAQKNKPEIQKFRLIKHPPALSAQ